MKELKNGKRKRSSLCYGEESIHCSSVTFDVVQMEHTKLENKTLATLVASPKDFQAERKETGVSYALVMKGVNDVMGGMQFGGKLTLTRADLVQDCDG
ncbi:hypothetical protein Tco_1532271 [Tanacetum coccineum]